jgi:hypothetical protein
MGLYNRNSAKLAIKALLVTARMHHNHVLQIARPSIMRVVKTVFAKQFCLVRKYHQPAIIPMHRPFSRAIQLKFAMKSNAHRPSYHVLPAALAAYRQVALTDRSRVCFA